MKFYMTYYYVFKLWRQRLAPYCAAGASVPVLRLGTSVRCLGKPRHCATPSGALRNPRSGCC